jgi:predicted Rossmann fold nucleotide-binding protein DprA/Smf involved in DNA uptake
MAAGRCLVSGGAVGADTETAQGALGTGAEGRMTLILPFGINLVRPDPEVCFLSVSEPDAPFSTGQAMERNALIYAYSPLAVVVKARHRTGGTWHGASDALRRRLTRLAVRSMEGDQAAAALCCLGGTPVKTVDDVFRVLAETPVADQRGRLDVMAEDSSGP